MIWLVVLARVRRQPRNSLSSTPRPPALCSSYRVVGWRITRQSVIRGVSRRVSYVYDARTPTVVLHNAVVLVGNSGYRTMRSCCWLASVARLRRADADGLVYFCDSLLLPNVGDAQPAIVDEGRKDCNRPTLALLDAGDAYRFV